MFGCGPKYFSERFNLKLERVYKTYALRIPNAFSREAQHKMFKIIHNSVNISPTEIILVSK